MKNILVIGIATVALAACAHKEPERPAAAPDPGPVVLHDNPSLGVGVPNYPAPAHHHAVPHHKMHKAPAVVHDETPPPAAAPERKQTWSEKAKGWAHKKFHKDE